MTASTNVNSEPFKSDEADAAASPCAPIAQRDKAHGIVRRSMYWAMGLGLVPVPLLDLAAVTAVQLKMLKELSELYGVSFAEDKAKTAVASLVAGLGGVTLAGLIGSSLLKVVPVLGQLVGLLGRPALAGALTLAVGNIFTAHYESGGTLLDLDIEKMREHFRREFESSQEAARKAQKSQRGSEERLPP